MSQIGNLVHGLRDEVRVTPVLKSQIDAGKINLTAIMNTHQ